MLTPAELTRGRAAAAYQGPENYVALLAALEPMEIARQLRAAETDLGLSQVPGTPRPRL